MNKVFLILFLTLGLLNQSAYAQFVSYKDVLDAENEAKDAENKFIVAVTALVGFIAISALLYYLRNSKSKPSGNRKQSKLRSSASWILQRVFGVLLVVSGLVLMVLYLFKINPAFDSGIIMPFSWVLSIFGMFLVNNAQRQWTKPAANVLAEDKRKPILFLRSFDKDEQSTFFNPLNWGSIDFETIEQSILENFNTFGPVVGLGNPARESPPLGYSPADTPNEKWQSVFLKYMDESQFIVALFAPSKGLEWELEQIFVKNHWKKLIIFFHDMTCSQIQSRWEMFLKSKNLPAGKQFFLAQADMLDSPSKPLKNGNVPKAITFDGKMNPILHVAEYEGNFGYKELALDLVKKALK